MAIILQCERYGRGVAGCSCCADVARRKVRVTDARRIRRITRQALKAVAARRRT